MSDQRESSIERILHRVENRVEEWRSQKQTRLENVEAQRNDLFEEAAERERRLAEAIGQEEEKAAREEAERHEFAFVVHSKEAGEALRRFSDEGARLVDVVSGRTGEVADTGLEGSWLIIEPPEERSTEQDG